jgi:hypothetical protein
MATLNKLKDVVVNVYLTNVFILKQENYFHGTPVSVILQETLELQFLLCQLPA